MHKLSRKSKELKSTYQLFLFYIEKIKRGKDELWGKHNCIIRERKLIEIKCESYIHNFNFIRRKKPTVKIKGKAESPQYVKYKYVLDIHK